MEDTNIDQLVNNIIYENQSKNRYKNKKYSNIKKDILSVIGISIIVLLFLICIKGCYYTIKERIEKQEQLKEDGWDYIELYKGRNKNNIMDAEIHVRKLLDARYGSNNYYFNVTNINLAGEDYYDFRFWYKAIPKEVKNGK